METDLPFARELQERGLAPDSFEALSCLRALRAATFRKRSRDLGPLLRFQRAHGRPAFPTQAHEVLEYFGALKAGKAARTNYGSTLAAVRFFEEAGRRAAAECLHALPSLTGMAKDLAADRARETADAEGKTKRQAPPLPVALVKAFEKVVRDEERPAFHRAYA